jgi:energy-coupling factor transporter transmembrane protein EcfT
MEKKLLAILGIIALIILYIGPVIIAFIVISGLFIGCFTIYKNHPNAISRVMSMVITPLLILGWVYMGYTIYSNEYCNTYNIRLLYKYYNDDYGTTEISNYTLVARTEKDLYVKIWRNFISENKKNIKSTNDFYHYDRTLTIWNQSKNKQCYPQRYENIDSLIEAEKLYYRIGEMKLDLLHLSRGW